MKKILSLILLMSLSLTLVACGEKKDPQVDVNEEGKQEQNELEEVSKTENEQEEDGKTTYIVGFDNTFAPMGFEKDGVNQGFDIDLAKKVQEKLGVEFKFQSIDWPLKETELTTGKIDMIWNGYSITEERKEKVLFSDPYMDNRILILTRSDSEINSIDDLKGKIVSTQDDSSSLYALTANPIVKEIKEIVTYPSYNEVFSDVKNARADALIVDETLGLYQISTAGESDLYKVLDDNLGSEQYSVGFRKDDEEFVKKFNEALKELKEDGSIDEIYSKWFK